ncbi:hypothetical protein V6N13_018998 [Hibiscus sabdariffa]
MKVIERRKGGSRSDNMKQKRDDRSQGSYKKAKHHCKGSLAYQSASRSQFTPKPQSVNKSSFPVMSVNSTGNLEKNANQASTRPPVHSSATPVSKNKGPKQAQSAVQGRGKGSHSNAQTHQESRAPARMYHVKGGEDEESPDVIADWLSEHQAWIDCYNRRLYLRGLGNESILVIDRKPTSIFAAMALQDEYDFGLPAMPIVSEFNDVFPEELPAIPGLPGLPRI